MSDKLKYIALLLLICFISAFSQVLLKKASLREYKSFIHQYLNLYVIEGYGLFLFVLVVDIFILRHLPIVICSVFAEATPLVFSLFTGKIIFGEKIQKRKLLGGIIIITGIIIILI